VLHFGLGPHATPVAIDILWPGGDTQTVQGAKPDRVIAVTYRKP